MARNRQDGRSLKSLKMLLLKHGIELISSAGRTKGEKTNIISEARIVRNIVSLAEMGLDLKKWSPGRKKGKGKKYTGKMQIYDGLFDIMWCRCDVTNTGVPCARCPLLRGSQLKRWLFWWIREQRGNCT